MSTKGPSFKYGNTNGEPTEDIAFPYAKDFNKHTLEKHFSDHKNDFGTPNKEQYESNAVHFANTIDRVNNESFIDKNKTTYKFNKKTETLCIITNDGYVISYFKPSKGYDYFKKIKRGKKNE